MSAKADKLIFPDPALKRWATERKSPLTALAFREF